MKRINFKVGDKVRCIDDLYTKTSLKEGCVYTVYEVNLQHSTGKCLDIKVESSEERIPSFFSSRRFVPNFDMHKSPWFIRFSNEIEYNLIQEFLKKEFGTNFNRSYSDAKFGDYLTNYGWGSVSPDTVFIGRGYNKEVEADEIKFEFVTTTKLISITYPEVKEDSCVEPTSSQTEIEKIEDEMRKLADRLKTLKEQNGKL